jgi:hypothetical protein
MAKTKRNVSRWDDEEEYRGKNFNRENKHHEKRLQRALKTGDFSMLEEEEYDEDGFKW